MEKEKKGGVWTNKEQGRGEGEVGTGGMKR